MPKKDIKITKTHKECSKCKEMILKENFANDLQKPYGLSSSCKKCRRDYYNLHKKEFLAKRKIYREKNRDKILASKRKYYKKNHDRIRELALLHYRKNREKINKKNSEWRKTSLKGRFMDCKRGAIKRNKEFNITLEQFDIETQNPCGYCGTTDRKRGLDRIDNNIGYLPGNVISCCWQCNWMKNDYSVSDFLLHCQKILNYTRLKFQDQ